MRLLVTIFMSIVLVACVSTQVDDTPDTDNSQSNNQQTSNNNTNDTNDHTNTDNSNHTDTANSNNDSSDNTNQVAQYQAPQPPIMEESVLSSANIQQLIVADGDDDDWEKFRQAYIVQYLKDLSLVPGALDKDMSKEVLEYLNKGYGMYWSPVKGIEKEVEHGFLAARSKNMTLMEKHLNLLASQGKGKDYYALAYIAAWTYSKNGAKDKAQSLIQQDNLITNVPGFGLDVPENDLQNLQAMAQ